jgi:hypothetical protein
MGFLGKIQSGSPLGAVSASPPCEKFHKLLAITLPSCFFTVPTPPVYRRSLSFAV